LAIPAVLVLAIFPVFARQQVFDLAGSSVDPLKQALGKVLFFVFVRTN